jgi:arsenate reductase-like glutaredoxin family protein
MCSEAYLSKLQTSESMNSTRTASTKMLPPIDEREEEESDDEFQDAFLPRHLIATPIHVYLEEDSDIFREVATRRLIQHGLEPENIHWAEDSNDLVRLIDAHSQRPNEAVCQVVFLRSQMSQEVSCEELLTRNAFFIALSSDMNQILRRPAGQGSFHCTMSMSFDAVELDSCLSSALDWHQSHSSESRLAPIPTFDVIVADTEAICCMAWERNLSKLGITRQMVVTDESDMVSALQEAQTDSDNPLVLFLGEESWLNAIVTLPLLKRRPFIINTSRSLDKLQGCNAKLAVTCGLDEIQKSLDKCLAKWRSSTRHSSASTTTHSHNSW